MEFPVCLLMLSNYLSTFSFLFFFLWVMLCFFFRCCCYCCSCWWSTTAADSGQTLGQRCGQRVETTRRVRVVATGASVRSTCRRHSTQTLPSHRDDFSSTRPLWQSVSSDTISCVHLLYRVSLERLCVPYPSRLFFRHSPSYFPPSLSLNWSVNDTRIDTRHTLTSTRAHRTHHVRHRATDPCTYCRSEMWISPSHRVCRTFFLLFWKKRLVYIKDLLFKCS